MLRELPSNVWLDIPMRKSIALAALSVAAAGAALAQVAASSSTYFLDVDPARYAGPAGQRLALQLDDAPRHVAISAQDEICVQLKRDAANSITAHVRVLKPEPHAATTVRVVAPDISPGTYRSTPWGMLLRVVPEKTVGADTVKPVGLADSPVCSL
jgi:hypothetical protein